MTKVLTATPEKISKRQSNHNFTEEIMNSRKSSNTQATSEVLFQKMGSTWYVFSEIKGDLVYSALPDGMSPHTTNLELFEVIEDHMQKVSKHYTRKPEMAL
jgi:hypothetical protein